MLMHRQKLKHVRLDRGIFEKRDSFVGLECAALVKQGIVYGVGTEDMDVSEFSHCFCYLFMNLYRH